MKKAITIEFSLNPEKDGQLFEVVEHLFSGISPRARVACLKNALTTHFVPSFLEKEWATKPMALTKKVPVNGDAKPVIGPKGKAKAESKDQQPPAPTDQSYATLMGQMDGMAIDLEF